MKLDEVNLISEGIAIIILTVIGFSLNTILVMSKNIEDAPGKLKNSFMLYIAGLIIAEKNANCTKMADKLGISHDKLNRILKDGHVIASKIGITLIKYCLSQTGSSFLVLDDVLIPKRYSKEIEGVYNEYDNIDKERLRGMRIVMIIWSNGKIRIPIAWAIWHKEDKEFIGLTKKGQAKYKHTKYCLLKVNGERIPYKTKNAIGRELLTMVLNKGLKPQYFTFDSWYAGKGNLQAFHLLCLPFYTRLKANRKVVFQGEKLSVEDLGKRFDIKVFNHKHNAYFKAVEVYLPHFGNIKLLFVRKDKHCEQGATKYLFSNNTNATPVEILLSYRQRWLIETVFRDVKQNLNFCSCQSRSLQKQETHIAFSLLGFVSLELQNVLHFNSFCAQSIGEKKNLLSSLFLIVRDGTFGAIDIRKSNSDPISFKNSFFDRVKSALDFASLALNYTQSSRSA